MKFTELKRIFEDKLGIFTLADIARELNVSPQVINNWKSRILFPINTYIQLKFSLKKIYQVLVIMSKLKQWLKMRKI